MVRDIVDVSFPDAEVVVLDNLNTHVGGALYEAFPPAEARRLLSKLEIHYTPKRGSWLNMAESELSVLSRQCLVRRIGTQQTLEDEVSARIRARHESATTVDWQFTTVAASIKLECPYPTISTPEGETV